MARSAGDDLSSEAPPEFGPRVGERLRSRRLQQSLTLAQTAARAGISTSYLSAIETGSSVPSIPILARVVAVLGLSLNEVLRDVGGRQVSTRSVLAADGTGPATLSSDRLRLRVVSVAAEAGAQGQSPVDVHGCDVFLYVVSGAIDVVVGESEYGLLAGDSLEAESPSTVGYRVVGTERAVMVWAAAPRPAPAA